MNDKYFYFRRSSDSSSSASKSDKGPGIGVLAVPTSKVSFISTNPGKVVVYFSNVGPYEDVQLSDGQVFEKAFVEISATIGEESELVSSILDFIVSDNVKKKIMRFDVLGDNSFRDSVVSNINDVNTIVPATPQSTPQRMSKTPPSGPTSLTIEGIDYGEIDNYPIIDFVAETSYITNGATAGTGTVESWANASDLEGATAYTLVPSFIGTKPFFYTNGSRATGGVDGTHIVLTSSQGFDFDGDSLLEVAGDYTIFMCVGIPSESNIDLFGSIYGVDPLNTDGVENVDRSSFGPFDNDSRSTISVRHGARFGAPATTKTDEEDDGTVSMSFPDLSDSSVRQTCYVFIVRRTELLDIVVHNHNGDIIASIPRQLGSQYADGTTNGNLVIKSLGTIQTLPKTKSFEKFFEGSLKRFGVIQRDIGASEAANIATILFNLYNPQV